jgi:hypothetical protein
MLQRIKEALAGANIQALYNTYSSAVMRSIHYIAYILVEEFNVEAEDKLRECREAIEVSLQFNHSFIVTLILTIPRISFMSISSRLKRLTKFRSH